MLGMGLKTKTASPRRIRTKPAQGPEGHHGVDVQTLRVGRERTLTEPRVPSVVHECARRGALAFPRTFPGTPHGWAVLAGPEDVSDAQHPPYTRSFVVTPCNCSSAVAVGSAACGRALCMPARPPGRSGRPRPEPHHRRPRLQGNHGTVSLHTRVARNQRKPPPRAPPLTRITGSSTSTSLTTVTSEMVQAAREALVIGHPEAANKRC